jgi:hypothetical protein
MATSSSRHTGDQVCQERQERGSRRRSIASPTPISETSTVNSVTWVMRKWWSRGSRLTASSSGSRPMAMPTATSTIGGETGTRRTSCGRTIASSRERPSRR